MTDDRLQPDPVSRAARWISAELLAAVAFAWAVGLFPGWWKLTAVLLLPFAVVFTRRWRRAVAARIRRIPVVQAAGAYLTAARKDQTP